MAIPPKIDSQSSYQFPPPFVPTPAPLQPQLSVSATAQTQPQLRPEQQFQQDQSPSLDPQTSYQNEQQDSTINYLLGIAMSSWPYSEETLQMSIRLRIEQERTKQESYKLLRQQKTIELFQAALNYNIPPQLVPYLFSEQVSAQGQSPPLPQGMENTLQEYLPTSNNVVRVDQESQQPQKYNTQPFQPPPQQQDMAQVRYGVNTSTLNTHRPNTSSTIGPFGDNPFSPSDVGNFKRNCKMGQTKDCSNTPSGPTIGILHLSTTTAPTQGIQFHHWHPEERPISESKQKRRRSTLENGGLEQLKSPKLTPSSRTKGGISSPIPVTVASSPRRIPRPINQGSESSMHISQQFIQEPIINKSPPRVLKLQLQSMPSPQSPFSAPPHSSEQQPRDQIRQQQFLKAKERTDPSLHEDRRLLPPLEAIQDTKMEEPSILESSSSSISEVSSTQPLSIPTPMTKHNVNFMISKTIDPK